MLTFFFTLMLTFFFTHLGVIAYEWESRGSRVGIEWEYFYFMKQRKVFHPRKCDSKNCDHIANSTTNYYFHRDNCKILMAEKHYTNEPGYKLLTDMVACKKEAKVKSLWIASTPSLHTSFRICSAKFKEVNSNRIQ